MSLKDLERYKRELEELKDEFQKRQGHPDVRCAIAHKFQNVLGELLRYQTKNLKEGECHE